MRLRELYSDPARFWFTVIAWMGMSTANYGVYLWGPSIVAMLLSVSVAEAAHWFVWVAAAGIAGKVVFSFLPLWIGRRRSGEFSGYGIFAMLAMAGILHGISGTAFRSSSSLSQRAPCSSMEATAISPLILPKSFPCAWPRAASDLVRPRMALAKFWARSASR